MMHPLAINNGHYNRSVVNKTKKKKKMIGLGFSAGAIRCCVCFVVVVITLENEYYEKKKLV